MRFHFTRTILATAALFIAFTLSAQEEGFIYGKITTTDQVYEGPIRWGKEEVYWNDIFNASKTRNENLKHLSNRDREALEERGNEWFHWSNNFRLISSHFGGDNDYVHQFSCQFGEMKSIKPLSSKYVELEMKNGQVIEVSGEGYNDVGTTVKVIDKELGEVEIRWHRLEKIEFMNTPSKLTATFGAPLFGTVEAYGSTFTGYIQWDRDERLSTDKLDGDSEDGDMAIQFGKIKSIERLGGRSRVVLKSGREMTLHGSNDVDNGNRGIVVMSKEFASITIPWREFEKVTFEEKLPGAVASYKDFKAQKELSGKVTTHSGKSFEGRIIYDLDEAHDYELLQGKEGDIEYAIPFRNVQRIATKGEHRCQVELRSGKKIVLDEGQDVNEKHQGILVFAPGKEDPTYIGWDDVNQVELL